MKNIILLAALTFSWHAFSSANHRAGDEGIPTASRINTSRQCFSEAVSSGCRHPNEGREEFRSCVREQMESFSSGCQTFMTKLYGKGI
jgi:hypothetical protein